MSRYPSAYGHTPSYKSVGGLSSYPSALSSSTSSSLTRDMDREMGAMKREMDRDFGVVSVSFLSNASNMNRSGLVFFIPEGRIGNPLIN